MDRLKYIKLSDIDPNIKPEGLELFDPEINKQYEEVIELIDKSRKKGSNTLIVHCSLFKIVKDKLIDKGCTIHEICSEDDLNIIHWS